MTDPSTCEVFEKEIVFIRYRMKDAVIQKILDKCLLIDELSGK